MKTTLPVKICGITRLQDAERAVELGAWALGFIFHEASPRYIRPSDAKTLVRFLRDALKGREVKLVGVFVNSAPENIVRVAGDVGLTTVQLHGDESPEFCQRLSFEVFKAVRPAAPADLDQLAAYRAVAPNVAAFLIDAPPAAEGGARGGTGRLADWTLAAAARRHGPVILSGGLKAENVRDAIRAVGPFALDVSSGVEESPGVKSPEKLSRFFAQISGSDQ